MAQVSEIIDALRAAGGCARGYDCRTYASPTPLAPDRLEALRAPDELALPPELRAWLAFDATWLPLFDDDGAWDETSPRGFAEDQMAEIADELDDVDAWDADDAVEQIISTLAADLRDAPAIRLPDSASQAHLLVFHDDRLLVLGYEKEEYWVKYESFAAFLAAYFGLS